MKIILKIAQAEFRNLFYSPIAWFVIIVFYLAIAMSFTFPMESLVRIQDVMLETYKSFPGFSMGMMKIIFFPTSGGILSFVYLFIPLLTMGIINREVTNGTMKLLYSSPIRIIDIVIGKYLAMIVMNIVLLMALALIFTTGYFTIVGAEYKWFVSMLLGFFLLLNTYAAIGIFISCLTGYQIVSAVATFAVFYGLSIISHLWQQYDFFRDITFFLTINGKAENMLMGLITTRDVSYFLLITILFLGFSLIKLVSTQETKSSIILFSRYIGLVLAVVIVGYFTSLPANVGYLDVTTNKVNTIAPPVQEEIRQLDGSPLKVTLYVNLLYASEMDLPQKRHDYTWGFWEKYRRFYPNLELDYVYYYDLPDGDSSCYKSFPNKTLEEIVEVNSEMLNIRSSLFMKPEEIRRVIDLGDEMKSAVMVVEYKGKKEHLRKLKKHWADQSHVAGVIKRLTRERSVNVGFLTGHLERSPWISLDRNYNVYLTDKSGGKSAINLGFDTDTLSLLHKEIPANLDLLVVADPKTELGETEQQRIEEFLNQGGNALFLLEPGKQELLNPVLKTIGVKAEDGIIVQPNSHEMPHYIGGVVTIAGCSLAKETELLRGLKKGESVSEIIVGAAHLSYQPINGFHTEPIMIHRNEGGSWLENSLLVIDSAAPSFSVAEGDVVKDQYVIGLKLTRQINNKEQRIIVMGDADLISNERWGNFEHAFYSWALYNEYPIYTPDPGDVDIRFSINSKQATGIQYVFVYIIPAILLGSAIVLLLRRKRK